SRVRQATRRCRQIECERQRRVTRDPSRTAGSCRSLPRDDDARTRTRRRLMTDSRPGRIAVSRLAEGFVLSIVLSGAVWAQNLPRGEFGPDSEPDPSQKLKEAIARLTKNLRTAEDRLGKEDAGEATRQVQRDILRDLDDLIEQAKHNDEQSQAKAANS